MRKLLLFLACPFLLRAELQVLLQESGVERELQRTADLGRLVVGDERDWRLLVRNTGPASVSLTTLRVAGTGFRLLNAPTLPVPLAPSTALAFTVRFAPAQPGSYSANLTVQDRSVLLLAVADPTATLLLEDAAGRRPLATNQPLDCGRVERGSETRTRLVLENRTDGILTIPEPILDGAAFRLDSADTFPLALSPRAEHAVDVRFLPASSGIHRGTLRLAGRNIPLEGVAIEPTPPRPRILLDSSSPRSATQLRVRLALVDLPRLTTTGTLRLSVEPATAIGRDDQAIRFATGPGRTLPFRIVEGSGTVLIDGQPEAFLQTGTTAGRILLTAELGAWSERAVLSVSPELPALQPLQLSRAPGELLVTLSGYDNTHSLSRLSFRFSDRRGQLIGSAPIQLDVARLLRDHFSSGDGGAFVIRLRFPVTGAANEIANLTVDVTNDAGSAVTPDTPIP